MLSSQHKACREGTFLLPVLVKDKGIAESTDAHFVPVLLTNLVSLYTKSVLYCLISSDTSRTVHLLSAVDFSVTLCSSKEAQARNMPLYENAT